MEKEFLSKEEAAPLMKAMKYRDGSQCCGMCKHFVSCDTSGNSGALEAHCDFNAVKFKVDPVGQCDWFEKKAKK